MAEPSQVQTLRRLVGDNMPSWIARQTRDQASADRIRGYINACLSTDPATSGTDADEAIKYYDRTEWEQQDFRELSKFRSWMNHCFDKRERHYEQEARVKMAIWRKIQRKQREEKEYLMKLVEEGMVDQETREDKEVSGGPEGERNHGESKEIDAECGVLVDWDGDGDEGS